MGFELGGVIPKRLIMSCRNQHFHQPPLPLYIPFPHYFIHEGGGGNEMVTNCNQLKLPAEDGKMRLTDCANSETNNYIDEKPISNYRENIIWRLVSSHG